MKIPRGVISTQFVDRCLDPSDLDGYALLELVADNRQLGAPAGRSKAGIDFRDLRAQRIEFRRRAETPDQVA